MSDETSKPSYEHVSKERYGEIVAAAHELVNGDEGWRFDLGQYIADAEAAYMASDKQRVDEETTLTISEVLGSIANRYLGEYKGYAEKLKRPLAALTESQKAFCRQCLVEAEWAPAQKEMWDDQQILRAVPVTALLMANLT